MEEITVKIISNYKRDTDIRNLLRYIAGNGKNKEKENVLSLRGRGIAKDYSKAVEQMIRIQKLHGKNNKRRCYQIIVSFPEKLNEYKNLIILMANEIAEMIFDEYGFQVYYGIHTSTGNIHIHFAINAVSYRTGKKWHSSKKEFIDFRNRILCCVEMTLKANDGYKIMNVIL